MNLKLSNISTKLIGLGAVGFIASFILMLEKMELIKNPNYVPSCSINPLFSCSNVILSPESSAFGFPNPLIGITTFAVVITIGFAILAGAKFKPWFWQGLQIGVIFGISFATWLMSETFFEIRSLCLYCMVVWSAMIPLFVYVTAHNLVNKNIVFNKSKEIGSWLNNHGLKVVIIWYLLIASTIFYIFWDFWATIFS